MSAEQALALATQTMLGTAKLLVETGQHPLELVKAVASPGGTTAEGLNILDASSITDTLQETITAATQRSIELS